MQVETYHLAWWRKWLARPFIRGVLRGVFHIMGPVVITGKENVLYGKPYIIAINHVSLFEAPFVGVFWPEQAEALGAADVWDRPGQNILARMWGGIKVNRTGYDMEAMQTAVSAIKAGYPMLIAPEGGRSHTPGMRKAYAGVAFMAEQTGVPVIPAGIVGTTDDYFSLGIHGKKPQLEMHIGKPILLPPVEGKGEARRECRQANADLVMRHIAGLVPAEYRGVYADSVIYQDK